MRKIFWVWGELNLDGLISSEFSSDDFNIEKQRRRKTLLSRKSWGCDRVVIIYPGRPTMDILVRSWQDLAKILEKL